MFTQIPLLAADSKTDPLLLSIISMNAMVEARDPYTGGHLWRVSQYVFRLTLKAGFHADEAARFALGAFLHDLGKIAIPDHILNKAGPLTSTEYDVMKTHPEVGAKLITHQPIPETIRLAIRHHHERPDGLGYPDGLKHADIPEEARVTGLCDAFDAMTSTRPYRQGLSVHYALDIIKDSLDTQFDPFWSSHFISLIESGECNDVIGHSDPENLLHNCPSCGPTLVIQRNYSDGDLIYCRKCGGENQITRLGSIFKLEATGRLGSARSLEPELDYDLLAELAAQWSLCGLGSMQRHRAHGGSFHCL
jgi:hypothetical protein